MPTLVILCLFASALTAQGFDFASGTTIEGKKVTVCHVDLQKESLAIFLRDDAGKPLKSFEGIEHWLEPQGKRLLFGMNAGMYRGDFSPVGLCVSKGVTLNPLNLDNGEGNFFLKPNGVFLISDLGARVIASQEYPALKEKVLLATQSGPLLLCNGRIHPAFQPGSKNRLYRNGVGAVSPQRIVFVISEEPVNFYEFAVFFRDGLHCENALFLDGSVSSLHAPELKRSDKKMDLGPIFGIVGNR